MCNILFYTYIEVICVPKQIFTFNKEHMVDYIWQFMCYSLPLQRPNCVRE